MTWTINRLEFLAWLARYRGGARKVADRVIFMDRDRIVEDAAKQDFFRSPRSERAQAFLSKILAH